jgi:hypothetical protein
MDPTMIVAAHGYCFCMFLSVCLALFFFYVGMSLRSLCNRNFGVCEGFPYLGRQVTTPESLYLRSSYYPACCTRPPSFLFLHILPRLWSSPPFERLYSGAEEEVYVVNLNGHLTVLLLFFLASTSPFSPQFSRASPNAVPKHIQNKMELHISYIDQSLIP